MVPANCPSCVCYSAQCPTAKGGGRVCEFDCHPGELEAAHLQQAARADPRVPGHLREAGKQRAPRAASDQGCHAVRSTGTMWAPWAGGHGTFPHHRGARKFNQERIAGGKMRCKDEVLDDATLLPLLQQVPLSLLPVLCRLQLEQIVFCQSGCKPLESFKVCFFCAADYVQSEVSQQSPPGCCLFLACGGGSAPLGGHSTPGRTALLWLSKASFPPACARQGLDLALPLEPRL